MTDEERKQLEAEVSTQAERVILLLANPIDMAIAVSSRSATVTALNFFIAGMLADEAGTPDELSAQVAKPLAVLIKVARERKPQPATMQASREHSRERGHGRRRRF